MQAIKRECLTKEHINKQAEIMDPVDPVQLERCIYAFEILGRLSDARIPFIFKGGTAVLLRLKKLQRLSVDVVEEKDEIYSNVQDIPIKMPFFELDHQINVRVPCVNCLLSDKMTAFAPNTVGVEYDPENSMQIIKQLFDIGSLFDDDAADDIQLIAKNYKIVFDAENSYRKGKHKLNSALDDTSSTSLLIAKMDIDQPLDQKAEKLLRTGIENIQSHLVNCKFKLNEAKEAAGKAALLSVLVKNKSEKRLHGLKYNAKDIGKLKEIEIPEPYKALNKLKATSPEAFHYWYHAVEQSKINN